MRTRSLTVYTELATELRRVGAGGRHPKVQVALAAPRQASIRKRRVVFYLARPGDTVWRRIAKVRWRRAGRLVLRATATYPAGTLGPADRVLVCTLEPRPDAFGRATPYDRTCGAPTLPRS